MDITIWIIIGIVVLLAAFAAIYYKKKNKIPADYRAFFIIGITWIPLGIATKSYAFIVMGIVFMAIGAKNKGKWKSNETKWKDLPAGGKTVRVILISLAVMLLVFGVFYYYFTENQM